MYSLRNAEGCRLFWDRVSLHLSDFLLTPLLAAGKLEGEKKTLQLTHMTLAWVWRNRGDPVGSQHSP